MKSLLSKVQPDSGSKKKTRGAAGEVVVGGRCHHGVQGLGVD